MAQGKCDLCYYTLIQHLPCSVCGPLSQSCSRTVTEVIMLAEEMLEFPAEMEVFLACMNVSGL